MKALKKSDKVWRQVVVLYAKLPLCFYNHDISISLDLLYSVRILTNIVTVNEIVGEVFKIQGRYSCSLLSVNYGIPSTIVLNKSCHLFLLQSLALEKYFSINIDLCPICHLFCNFFNSKYIKGIWGLIKKTQGVFHLSEKKKSWPQYSSNVHTSQKLSTPSEKYFLQEI